MKTNRNPIKWYGGKAKIADEILRGIPEDCTEYIEPFLGSASVLRKAVEKREWLSIYASDMNADLINFWDVLRNPEYHAGLLHIFNCLSLEYNSDPEQTFLKLRAENCKGFPLYSAVRFHLLNQTGFNGLYRTNKQGKNNTPWGKKETYQGLNLHEMAEISSTFRNIELKAQSYIKVSPNSSTQAFVYLDPPYIPVNNNSAVNYGCPTFNWLDFQPWVQDLHRAGHKITLSHTENADIDELFWFLNHRRVVDHRHVSASVSVSRKAVSEVLYSNYKP